MVLKSTPIHRGYLNIIVVVYCPNGDPHDQNLVFGRFWYPCRGLPLWNINSTCWFFVWLFWLTYYGTNVKLNTIWNTPSFRQNIGLTTMYPLWLYLYPPPLLRKGQQIMEHLGIKIWAIHHPMIISFFNPGYLIANRRFFYPTHIS